MTISTNDVPTKGGTIEDAIAQSGREEQPPPEAKGKTIEELDNEREGRERKPTRYMVAEVMETGDGTMLRVLGSYIVSGGQSAARLAAIEEHEGLRERIVRGEPVTLAALSNYNPVQPRLENREPKIVA